MAIRFRLVDVFGSAPFLGNPLAVVLDASGLTAGQMQAFARWMNLSETTFVLPPRVAGADYRVRIFTPSGELPFAGHPTLGTCHAWLEAGNSPARPDRIVQECDAGLVRVRETEHGLAFGAPPLIQSGPLSAELRERVAAQLGIAPDQIVASQWADNGPGWIAALLGSADEVLALRPGFGDLAIGVAGAYPAGGPADFEVRTFFPLDGLMLEDPVTGSFNASLAQWLLDSGRVSAPYLVSQGTVLGRSGRVHVLREQDQAIWVAGATTTAIEGTAEF